MPAKNKTFNTSKDGLRSFRYKVGSLQVGSLHLKSVRYTSSESFRQFSICYKRLKVWLFSLAIWLWNYFIIYYEFYHMMLKLSKLRKQETGKLVLQVRWFHLWQPSHWSASCLGLTTCWQTRQNSLEDMMISANVSQRTFSKERDSIA